MIAMSVQNHLDAAADLLTDAGNASAYHDETNPAATLALAEAQVHATLAVAEQLRTLTSVLTATGGPL